MDPQPVRARAAFVFVLVLVVAAAGFAWQQWTATRRRALVTLRAGADVYAQDMRNELDTRVSHLRQIVDLHARPDVRLAHACAVHAGIRLHFHRILQHGRSRLDNLVPNSVLVLRESKPVRPDNCAVLQHHVIPNTAVLAHNRVRVRKKVMADHRMRIDHHVWQQRRMVPNDHALAHNNIRANMSVTSDLRRGVNHGRRMNTRRINGLLVKKPHGLCKRQVRIFRAQRCRRNLGKIRCHNNRSSLCCLRQHGIARIGDKRHMLRPSLFDTCHTRNQVLRVPVEFRAKNARKFS